MKVPTSDIRFIDPEAPQVSCTEFKSKASGVFYWRFTCKHCGVEHLHGVGDGHREAHCVDPASPYHRTGYNLILLGEDEDN